MDDLPVQYLRGIELFNAGEFFACHEVWEEIWLKAEGVEREFLHALIQSAVALHHFQRGNPKGASSVYQRARKKLGTLPPAVMRLDTQDFANHLDDFFRAALSAEQPLPSLPKIRLQDER
jgi:predicted metal-dependent hydrolase